MWRNVLDLALFCFNISSMINLYFSVSCFPSRLNDMQLSRHQGAYCAANSINQNSARIHSTSKLLYFIDQLERDFYNNVQLLVWDFYESLNCVSSDAISCRYSILFFLVPLGLGYALHVAFFWVQVVTWRRCGKVMRDQLLLVISALWLVCLHLEECTEPVDEVKERERDLCLYSSKLSTYPSFQTVTKRTCLGITTCSVLLLVCLSKTSHYVPGIQC